MDARELTPGQLLQLSDDNGSDLFRFRKRYLGGAVLLEWLFTWPHGAQSGFLPDQTRFYVFKPDQVSDFTAPSGRIVELYAGVRDGAIAPATAP